MTACEIAINKGRGNRIKRKILKVLTLCLVITLITTSFASAGLAKSAFDTKNSIDEKTIEKIDKYIEIDPETKLFFINKEGIRKLKGKDLKIANECVDRANGCIAEAKKTKDVSVNVTDSKSVRVRSNAENMVGTLSIAYYSYSDWEVKWWGIRVYLSHACVEELRRNQSYILAGTSAIVVVSEGVISFILTSCELGSIAGPVGSIVAGAIAAGIAINITRILFADQGKGVIIDYNWLQASSPFSSVFLSKITPVKTTV